MDILNRAGRLAASASILALAACGGNGGGGASVAPPATTTAGNTNTGGGSTSTGNTNTSGSTTTTVPNVDIEAASAPTVALQTVPVFNFTTNPPPVGTVIGIPGPGVKITSTAVVAAGDLKAQAVYRGTVTANGQTYPVFDLSLPSLSVNATNLRGDGTVLTMADGSKVAAAVGTLTYTLLGAWTYAPAGGGTSYIGAVATGSATPVGSLPTSGTATYSGTGTKGGVVGAYFVPSGTGTVTGGTLTGDLSLTADFAGNSVRGSMTNMVATPGSGGAATPWNTVSLQASIGRPGGSPATFTGTTAAGPAPANAGSAGFSSGATGRFLGGFFGPSADEVGATWTLSDPTAAGGGKSAFGAFAGSK